MIGDENQDGSTDMRYLLKNSDYEDIFKLIEENSNMNQDVISEDIAFSFAQALIDNIKISRKISVIVFAGNGIKGLIGSDISRILSYKGIGIKVCICISENSDNVSTENTGHTDLNDMKNVDSTVIMKHVKSAESFGCAIYEGIPDEIENMDFDIAVDALSDYSFAEGGDLFSDSASDVINMMRCKKISLLIPYGVDPDNSKVSNRAVCADMTISTNIGRNALFMYPGCTNCGKIIFADTCLDNKKSVDIENKITVLESSSDVTMPSRDPSGNKGTFGKILIIAGHRNVCGAAILSCRSAYRSGCGMVKLLTTESNRVIVQESVPEVMLDTYQDDEEIISCAAPTDVDVNADEAEKGANIYENIDTDNTDDTSRFWLFLENDIKWADSILIGPGIGTGKTAIRLVREISEIDDKPIVFDADALNIIAVSDEIRNNIIKSSNDHITITPHMGELSRLLGGMAVEDIKKEWILYVKKLSDELGVTVVSKDARTLIISPGSDECYLNVRGNSGLATAGSGDVLAGIVAALSSKRIESCTSAAKAVLLHAQAGERASKKRGERSVMAGDIIEEIPGDINDEF